MFKTESQKIKERLNNQEANRTIPSKSNKEPKGIVQNPSNVKSSQETFTIIQDDYMFLQVSPSEGLILMYLLRKAKLQKSNRVLVKAKDIAFHSWMCLRSVFDNLDKLISKGYIKSKSQKGYFTEIEIDIEKINEDIKKKKDEFQVSE